ncbi:hypothetical protein K502DRAFT_311132 [Neoconidiobolus thromboides FSU 785]|nr:hypothetical protein K502DRAFT_311132 [Neoconidiobolus thromboides FSU 785]
MPACIECGYGVNRLYIEYGKGNVVLTKCTRCHRFADKYIEHDLVILVIDMVLHKPQVYRHLIFNRIEYCDVGLPSSIKRLEVLIILFDIYIKWFQIERIFESTSCTWLNLPPLIQYFHISIFSLIEQFLYHIVIRFLVQCFYGYKFAIFKYNYVSLALIISNFGKLLLVAMAIWDYHGLQYSWLLALLTFTSNVEALKAFLETKYLFPFIIILSGWIVRMLIIFTFSYTYFDTHLTLWPILFT